MKNYWVKQLSIFPIIFLMLSIEIRAAEIVVTPGANTLRTAITNAASGDVLILEDGTYTLSNTDLIIDKSLTIRSINAAANSRLYFLGGSNIPGIVIQGAETDFIMQGVYYYEGAAVTNRPEFRVEGAVNSVALLENQFSMIDFHVVETSDTDGNKFVVDDLIIVGNSFSGSSAYLYQIGAKNNFIFAGNGINHVSLRLYNYGADAHIIGNAFISATDMIWMTNNSQIGSYSRVVGNLFRQTLSAQSNSTVSNMNYNMITLEGWGDFSNNILIQGLNPYSASGTPGSFQMLRIGNSSDGFWSVSNNVFDSKATGLLDNTPLYKSTFDIFSPVKFENNIITNNVQPDIIILENGESEVYSSFSNNLCFNNVGDCNFDENRIESDPKFVDDVDYVLESTSPAINAGVDKAGYRDADGSVIDIGAHGGPFSYLQFAKQRTENTVEPYFYPLFEANSSLSTSGNLKVKAVAIARLR